MSELSKSYNPAEHEEKIYRLWEEGGYFRPQINADYPCRSTWINPRESAFCIIMPPPNANGDLHIGHALFVTLEDIMTRYNRLLGKRALWLPGADHAGFETQIVYERKLEKQGKTRLEMPREEFFQQVWDFTMENKKNMEAQIRRLGASCDWSRAKFTLDPDIIQIVYHTFKTLYEDGLVYRGRRLVNYCVKHQTSFSDLEVKYIERKDPLYYIKYPIAQNSKSETLNSKSFDKLRIPSEVEGQTQNPNLKTQNPEFIVVATVRPETMLGDVAATVHPEDERYKNLVGQYVELPLTGRKIPIIAEESVDPDFGTGVVKVTPAHDMTDWEIGQRHQLEARAVIDKTGRMNEKAGKYAGLTVEEARKAVVEDLKNKGLIQKVDEGYTHNVGVCYKCGTVIEPMLLPQWFVRMQPLAKKAIEAVQGGKIKIIPEHFKKTYFHWLENIKDWNISRQIWWGIAIPAWRCAQDEKWIVTTGEKPEKCPDCGSTNLEQDSDTFDTWFSSGQWPFATLLTSSSSKSKIKNQKSKIPWSTDDFETFYPTSVMETGYEILFFWVARMIMLGLYITGEVPFKTIYLHGTVRDKYKRKMSKSLGNVVNPMEIVDLYGSDALRMGLIVGNTPGTDLALDEEKIAGYRNFANKLWNISRFILIKADTSAFSQPLDKAPHPQTDADKAILEADRRTIQEVTELMNNLRFYLAGEKLYHYAWHELADKYIEASKQQLENEALRFNTSLILAWLIRRLLVMLHPFMPFVTETIWQFLPADKSASASKPLIIQNWPR